MQTLVIDANSIVKKLEARGFSRIPADDITEALKDLDVSTLATKVDLTGAGTRTPDHRAHQVDERPPPRPRRGRGRPHLIPQIARHCAPAPPSHEIRAPRSERKSCATQPKFVRCAHLWYGENNNMSPMPCAARAPHSSKNPDACPHCGSHVLTRRGTRKAGSRGRSRSSTAFIPSCKRRRLDPFPATFPKCPASGGLSTL